MRNRHIVILCLLLVGSCKHASEEVPSSRYNIENIVFEYNEDSIINAFGALENGKKNGVWLYFNDEGALLREASYERGMLHGTLTEYREGKVFFTVPYVNDKKSGFYQSYNYICNSLASKGYFKDNQMDGLWYEYYNGVLIELIQYNEGKQVKILYKHPEINLAELPPFPNRDCFTQAGDNDPFLKDINSQLKP